MPAVRMYHEVDPKTELMTRVGDISGLELFANDVAVAVYKRPEKTRGGIIMTDVTRGEDIWQSKTGLIVKMGPLAFKDDENTQFRDEERCAVGDFVIYRPSDGWMATLNNAESGSEKVLLRILKDVSIRGRVADPDLIY